MTMTAKERRVAYRHIKRAGSIVFKAIRRGDLRKPSEFACVDCGNPAIEYDHRDYSKPLEVDPVCSRCNKLRGPGIKAAA